jgi:hypothetical protein
VVLEQTEGNYPPDSFTWVVKYKETTVDLASLSELVDSLETMIEMVEIFVVPSRTRLVMMYQCQPTLGSLHC